MKALNAQPEPISDSVFAEAPESQARAIVDVVKHDARRPRRLRARRVRAEELHIDGLEVHGRHSTLGAFQGVVEDLSLTGLALTLVGAAGKGNLILNGDRLDRLQVTCRSAVLYEG